MTQSKLEYFYPAKYFFGWYIRLFMPLPEWLAVIMAVIHTPSEEPEPTVWFKAYRLLPVSTHKGQWDTPRSSGARFFGMKPVGKAWRNCLLQHHH